MLPLINDSFQKTNTRFSCFRIYVTDSSCVVLHNQLAVSFLTTSLFCLSLTCRSFCSFFFFFCSFVSHFGSRRLIMSMKWPGGDDLQGVLEDTLQQRLLWLVCRFGFVFKSCRCSPPRNVCFLDLPLARSGRCGVDAAEMGL